MRRIIITEPDRRRLETLLTSEFARVAGSASYRDALSAELQRAQVVPQEDVPRGVVTMNSTVVLRDLETGERETYTLVFPQDANIGEGRLSILAPVGTAILGERVGDEIHWLVPGGWRRLKIEKVAYESDRAEALAAVRDRRLSLAEKLARIA